MASETISRRSFVGGTSAGAAVMSLGPLAFMPSSVMGANERLSLGMVGPGARGRSLMDWAHKLESSHNVQFTAVCDIWNERRQAGAKTIQEWTGKEPYKCRTLEEIGSLKDVDVLIIATADFQHCYHLVQAVRAGKDVYCEKPLGNNFYHIKKALEVVRASDRVVQLGTQSRAKGQYFGARDFIKAGKLGKVSFVEIYEPLFQERWRIPGAETSIRPEDTDWREYLAYLDPQEYEWNPRHYREFRLYWPFSSGCFDQWMSHRIDLVNLALDELPKSAVAHGGVYVWKDGRTNPDTVQCLLEYPSGTLVTYHMRLGNGLNGRDTFIYGTNGTMDLNAGIAYGEGGGGTVTLEGGTDGNPTLRVDASTVLTKKTEGGVKWDSPPDVDHMGHFFECVRSRQQPRANIEAGFGHALATTLANLAYRSGAKMEYDARTMTIRSAA